MAVRSRRLVGPTVVNASTASTLYTVPSDRTAIVRTIIIGSNSTSTDGSWAILLNGTGLTANGLWKSTTMVKGTTTYLDVWLALNPGDFLRASMGAGANAVWTIFGALLLGEPS